MGYYPPEYERFGERDWPALLAIMEAASKETKLAALGEKGLAASTQYALARTAKIRWPEDKKAEIVSCLAAIARDVLSGKSYLDWSEAYKTVFAAEDDWVLPALLLPAHAVWCMLAVDSGLAGDQVLQIWEILASHQGHPCAQRMRIEILTYLELRFDEGPVWALVSCLKPGAKGYSAVEHAILERMRLKHDLLALRDEQEALVGVLRHVGRPSLEATLDSTAYFECHHAMQALLAAYPRPSGAFLPRLLSGNRAPPRTYLLLHCACYLLNVILSQGQKPDQHLIRSCLAAVDAFYKAHAADIQALSAKPGFCDFLARSSAALRRQMHWLDAPKQEH
jgi:hypothetical protein